MTKEVPIESRDYWFKIVEFLQQNWALVDPHERGAISWFIGDTSGVFDQIVFSSPEEAFSALTRNGFRRFANNQKAQPFLRAPEPRSCASRIRMDPSTQAADFGDDGDHGKKKTDRGCLAARRDQ
jgi:hypothetical protein